MRGLGTRFPFWHAEERSGITLHWCRSYRDSRIVCGVRVRVNPLYAHPCRERTTCENCKRTKAYREER